MTKQINLFIDMDGVIATWQKGKDFMVPGYFETIPINEPITKVLSTIKDDVPNCRLFILSKMTAAKRSMPYEKLKWLDNYPVQFDAIYFCPGDMFKGDYIKQYNLQGLNILLDDFNANLTEWEGHGENYKAIKFVNHVNSPSATYDNVLENEPNRLVSILRNL